MYTIGFMFVQCPLNAIYISKYGGIDDKLVYPAGTTLFFETPDWITLALYVWKIRTSCKTRKFADEFSFRFAVTDLTNDDIYTVLFQYYVKSQLLR